MKKGRRQTRVESQADSPRRPLPWRALVVIGSCLGLCLALGWAAFAVRSCAKRVDLGVRTRSVQRIYEYGSSIARDSRIILASRTSSFVIPKDIVKKLILGLSSTASVQISCQAQILWTLPVDALLGADQSWTDGVLTLSVDQPEALRPLIETSSIHRAILDRGFLVNEAAELDDLLSSLSDMVAADPGAAADEGILETCRASLQDICERALGEGDKGALIRVVWREPRSRVTEEDDSAPSGG